MRSLHFVVRFEKWHIVRLSRHTFLLKPRILEPKNQSNQNSASLPPGLVYIEHGRQEGDVLPTNLNLNAAPGRTSRPPRRVVSGL